MSWVNEPITKCAQLPGVPSQVCYSEHQQELNLPQHLSKGLQTLENTNMCSRTQTITEPVQHSNKDLGICI